MKKYFKYFIVLLFVFVTFISSVNAVTIKETLINGDGYDTIQDGSIVIGVTKFDPTTVVTGGRATKAGSDAAIMYLKEHNGSLEGYETPVIYVLAGGSWYALDKNNDASLVTDNAIIDELSNKKIYFVNDEEKVIDIDVSGIDIDESKLPEGVTYKDGKIYVKATTDSVVVVSKDGYEYKFVKDNDLFMLDQSACYTISGSTITGYSNTCSKDVKIPSKVNDVSIDSIAADAFRNKALRTLIIPGHINSLGDNAFAENEFTHVTIEDKYDEEDFEYYGNNVFGDFTDIKYTNDLTELLDQFKDEITLNVRKGTMSDEIDSEIYNDNIYRLPGFAKYLELKRLGLIKDTETGLFNNKYYINYSFDYDDETYETKTDNFMVIVGFFDVEKQKNYEAKKYVSYTVDEVDSENEDYKKIKQEYEEYFESVREKVKNKDYSLNLLGYDKIYELADKYGYSISQEAGGIGDGGYGSYIPGDETFTFIELIYDDVMYSAYFEVPYYMAIEYNVELEEIPETKEEIYEAMILNFEQGSQITNYDVLVEDSWTNAVEQVTYYRINIKDKETNNIFALEISVPLDKGSIVENHRFENNGTTHIQYSYIPTKTLEEYNGKVSEYMDFVTEELKEKANLSDDSRIFYSGGSSNGVYNFAIESENDNIVSRYEFIIDNSSVGPINGFGIERIFYELDIDYTSIEGGYSEYMQAAVEQFCQEKNVTDYWNGVSSTYMKDPVTNEFSYYNGAEGVEIYFGAEVTDFSTNTIYTVVFPHY